MRNSTDQKTKFIYVIRDSKGIIDGCDILLLQSIYALCSNVKVVLCGDFGMEESRQPFFDMCDEVSIKKEECSDYHILQDEICSEQIKEYDELLFMSNSVFGPFYPLDGIVDSMRGKGYDYWGLTKVGEVIDRHWRIIPEHLQLYFFAIERRMLLSEELQEFFRKRIDASQFEIEFTQYFDAKGFQRGTYINLTKYDANYVTNNIDMLYNVAFELISQYSFPFLKKDYFVHKDLSNSNATDLKDCMAYLERKKLYNMDYIWDYVLRCYNISQIKDSMQLNYILSDSDDGMIKDVTEEDYQHAAVIMHLAYEESIDEVCQYVLGIPKEIKKFFVVIREEQKAYLEQKLLEWESENYEVRVMYPNRGRDMNSLFVVCRDVWENYAYLCFAHDKRTKGDTGAYTVGKEFMNILWDNTLRSGAFITRVLALLKREKRLGYLTVPVPYHSKYCKTVLNAWTKSYQNTVDLAERMHLAVDMAKEYPPFSIGNAFWCKTDALKDIINLNLKTEDFWEEPMPGDGTISHALERIVTYAAQNAGYYSGILESSYYAQGEINNKNYMLVELMRTDIFESPFYISPTFSEMLNLYKYDNSLSEFLSKKKKLYVWGTGKTGKNICHNLEKMGRTVCGYICSDGYDKPTNANKKVYYLSEIDSSNDEIGIILAMHKRFYKELKPALERIKGNIYYI